MTASDRKRIALVLPDLRGGGAERVNLTLASEFLQLGHEVDLVVLQKSGELIEQLPDKVRLIDLKTPRIRDLAFSFSRYLKLEKPAGVIVNIWPLTCSCVVGRWLSRQKTRLVVVDHNSLTRAYQHFSSFQNLKMRLSILGTYRFADARVAVSQGVGKELARLGWMSPEKIDAIYNPIPCRTVDRVCPATEALWGHFEGQRILNVGHLKAQKNQALLIRAFAKQFRDKNAKLMILGDGPLRSDLERLAHDEGVENQILMPGFVKDPVPVYASADLFVLSSSYEGFGNVIVEAMNCGTPILSTNCQFGPDEILADGQYGKLVPVNNIEELASGMAEVLGQPIDAQKLKDRAQEFAPEIAAREYLRILFP